MTSELTRRILFTLGALLVFRLGTFIPLPGISPSFWEQIFRSQADSTLGMANLLSGGAIHRLAIFALGLVPYISAAVLLQLLPIISKRLRALRTQGERGRRTIDLLTRSLTALLSLLQAYGIAMGLEGVPGLVAEPGWLFRTTTVLTLTGGVMALVWLSDWITARGVGNGVTLILFAGIVAEVPAGIAAILEFGRSGFFSGGMILALLGSAFAFTSLIVAVERARRRLPIVHIQRAGSDPHWHLPLKLNSAGVIPAILASWILFVPLSIVDWVKPEYSGGLLADNGPLVLTAYAILIVGCTFFYTAYLVDPDAAAEILMRQSALIEGISPGEPTAEHIDGVVTRLTMIGAIYLALVYVVPAVMIGAARLPFYFGGASLLIVVCAILDLEAHIRAFASVKTGG
jgi:preprotein translocase subunit SecY